MRRLLLVALTGLAAASSTLSCDDGDGDADADADTDVDTDADADGECGEQGGPCCEVEPACRGSLVCAARPGEDAACYAPCDPGRCDYGGRDGYCVAGGPDGVCAVSDATSVYCEFAGCETEYGVSDATTCVEDPETFLTYCFETCELPPATCAETEVCVGLADGGGVCLLP